MNSASSRGMMFAMMMIVAVVILGNVSSFAPPKGASSSSRLYMDTNRKSRRNQKKETQGSSRPNAFYNAIKETEGKTTTAKKDPSKPNNNIIEEEKPVDQQPLSEAKEESVVAGASVSDAAVTRERPEVSKIIIDEETGIERIQQGRAVMDVITRKAVKLLEPPEHRMAQMFPGVPPDIRARYRMNWDTVEVPDMIQKFRRAAIPPDGTAHDIPPHPSVSDGAIDFVLANRDYLGSRMKKTLGRLKLRAQSLLRRDEALDYRKLWKHFLTIEDHISAPFRQLILNAEGVVGPNFGNLDVKSYCDGPLYERTANYLVLKGMVAHWEKKLRDAEYVESTPMGRDNFLDVLMVGDPKRYLPDPPIIFRYDECIRIALMAQNMTARFVSTPELFDDLPPEVRFVERASFIKSGTGLRQFMIQEFCPAEGITPEALREGLRRLDVQMSNMQIDPYGDLKNVIGRLCEATAVGTNDERDPYLPYLANFDTDGPGYFQTYTFDHDRQSMVRFLDNAKAIQQGTIGPTDNVVEQLSNEAANLFGLKTTSDSKLDSSKTMKRRSDSYVIPEDRAIGRPHNLGWLNLLGDEEVTGGDKDVVKNGDDGTFESDNWREVIVKRQGSGQN